MEADAYEAEQRLKPWIGQLWGTSEVSLQRISGGNRCFGWRVTLPEAEQRDLYLRYQPFEGDGADPYDLRREAGIYSALQETDIPIPRFVAAHPHYQAMLTEHVEGKAEYRHLADSSQKAVIADEAIRALAQLHALDVTKLDLPLMESHATVSDAVRAEIETWRVMYAETGRRDPLIEFAYQWLIVNQPDVKSRPALVHGDAGPGNFMFADGHMTKMIDWELAHLGDPMEDLAWFSMRSVMEPVPDFPRRLEEYARVSGQAIDHGRLLYHRAFVSFRVVIIRHRNSSGEIGSSIISRALNRRLLIEAIAAYRGVELPTPVPLVAADERWTAIYDEVVDDLREIIVPRSTDSLLTSKAKNAAKAIKYLRSVARLGGARDAAEARCLAALLGREFATLDEGRQALLERIDAKAVGEQEALLLFASDVAWETQLAADSMGGLAARQFPPLA